MRSRRSVRLGYFLGTFLALPVSASVAASDDPDLKFVDLKDIQEIFEKNAVALCNKRSRVDLRALGLQLTARAQVTPELTEQLNSNYVKYFAPAPLWAEELHERQRRQVQFMLDSFLTHLNNGSDKAAAKKYQIANPDAKPVDAENLFAAKIFIDCKTKEARPGKPRGNGVPPTGDQPIVERTPEAFQATPKIGLAREDLFKPTDKSGAFTLSLKEDNDKDQISLSIDGVAGVVFSGTGADLAADKAEGMTLDKAPEPRALTWWKLAVYNYVKIYEQDPDSKSKPDINYLAPGIALNYTRISADRDYAFDLMFDATPVFDQKNNAILYTTGVNFSPAFRVNGTRIFGTPFAVLGDSVWVLPEFNVISRYAHVEDSGQNVELQNAEDYLTFGFDLSAEMSMPYLPSLLSNLSAGVRYAYRYNTNGIADVDRFTVGLNYIPAAKNFTIGLDYTDGRDVNTLQNEDRVDLNVKFRY
jgi:hypothetical protein